MENKCRGMKDARYDEPTVKAFEDWLERIDELQVAVEKRKERQLEKEWEKIRIERGAYAARPMESNRQTAQIIRPKVSPVWTKIQHLEK